MRIDLISTFSYSFFLIRDKNTNVQFQTTKGEIVHYDGRFVSILRKQKKGLRAIKTQIYLHSTLGTLQFRRLRLKKMCHSITVTVNRNICVFIVSNVSPSPFRCITLKQERMSSQVLMRAGFSLHILPARPKTPQYQYATCNHQMPESTLVRFTTFLMWTESLRLI